MDEETAKRWQEASQIDELTLKKTIEELTDRKTGMGIWNCETCDINMKNRRVIEYDNYGLTICLANVDGYYSQRDFSHLNQICERYQLEWLIEICECVITLRKKSELVNEIFEESE